jgi:hypothetical protein
MHVPYRRTLLAFNYRSVVGKLNYLEKATRSDISYAIHQCARFVSDPKVEHGEAVRWLGRYLKGTRDKGTILKPIPGIDLEVHVDASFCGDWDPQGAATDRDTARSRHYQLCRLSRGLEIAIANRDGAINYRERIQRSKLCTL